MSDSTKRAERRENELKHWERRLEREFNNNGRKYVDQGEKFCKTNLKIANIPDDLKNSKGGRMLKHTNYLDKKDSWKDADIKNYYKKDRFNSKREICNSIYEYEQEHISSAERLRQLKLKLSKCNDDILFIENLLHELPERLSGLKTTKKEIEEEICWLQYGNC